MKVLALAASAVLIAGLTVAFPVTAMARDCSKGTTSGGNSVKGGIHCPGQPPEGSKGKQGTKGKSSSSAKPACVWVPKPDYIPSPGEPADGDGGHYYQKFCAFADFKTLDSVLAEIGRSGDNMRLAGLIERAGLEVRFFTTPPEVPRRTPEEVMASVVDELEIPDTYLAVNPVAAKQVIGIPTWVWLTDADGNYVPHRYGAKSTEVELEGYRLAWQIVPAMTITPGDGGAAPACTGVGVPWSKAAEGDASACTVTYERPGQYALSAAVGWTVRWWLGGVEQEPIAGPTNAATTPVSVLELQVMNR